MSLPAKNNNTRNKLSRAMSYSKYDEDHLAMICHEIGTPLNIIIGLSQILSTIECNPQKKKEYASMIKDSSDMITSLLRNLLYSSKMNAGMIEMENIDFDLIKIIRQTIHIMATKVAEKGLKLHVHIADEFPSQYVGDSLRISQVLMNLISNAVKFTEKGHIAIFVSKTGEDQIRITIADTGIGIDKDSLENIFHKYAQANSSISREYGGTGLGLSICRDLVHLMHGEITVKSSPGIGSRFTVTLPLKMASEIS